MLVPIILSGGSGTRLWPLSRKYHPKQLLPLLNHRTMLQNTVLRLQGLPGLMRPVVVCNEEHRFMVAAQLQGLEQPPKQIILEPFGRNTAPAAAVAALWVLENIEDQILFVLPADHAIRDDEVFRQAAISGLPYAEAGRLITFGVVPTAPETGYGYLKAGRRVGVQEELQNTAFSVDRFVEKPDRSTAESYLADGNYYWNSGMFMFRASRYLEELRSFAPDIVDSCREAVGSAVKDLDFLRLDSKAFSCCVSDSIDYAVMEKTNDALMIPLDAGWSDVGSWSALWENATQTSEGNVCIGDVFLKDTEDSYVHGTRRFVATVGIKNAVVVETADAVLVAGRDRVQDVKFVVDELNAKEREEALRHRLVNRPWGSYESIEHGEGFQVKRITVNPGEGISLQFHRHRSEHWIIVKGTARVTRGDNTYTLQENQSTYINVGEKHRLENPGAIPLELIEVQTGSYLGEDDIVRFEDKYGRVGRAPAGISQGKDRINR